MKSDVFNNHNNLITKKRHLKVANIYYISRYYQLFQQTSYITMKYSKDNPNTQGIKNDSTNFYNKYISLYNDINEYLPSLKRSKKTITVGFNCEECEKINSNAEKKKTKPAPKVQEPLNPKPVASPFSPHLPSKPTTSTTSLPPQTDASTQKTTVQINVQLLKSPNSDSISRTPWNIIPTTWNGSGDCKPKINLMSATYCVAHLSSVYLSSVWRKEIKRKKNMKKVINSIGGKDR
ncbi:hypothetical protein YYE_04580 [Plasmodium vinckei vinckei]|uniref:CIR protein PIR protein n=1 Tax=Plasmodium vinckei vinckei TaxID=54757 RepID=A0A081I9N9_PLAVN|nr:hypothetical protein YYE_04580 [Plasmodium vinckei vinckei]